MSENKIEYSIVIGALREEKRIGKTLEELYFFLKERNILEITEVVVVIAASGDNTYDIVKSYRSSFVHMTIIQPGDPVGKGRDIKLGMLKAYGKMRIFMDADLATPLHHLDTVFENWEKEKFDVLIGVRNLVTIHKDIFRRSISRIGNLVFFLVGGFYIQDTQCGFKAFSKEAAEKCFSKLTRMSWSFDMELLIIAKLNGYKIEQIDIVDWKDVPGGTFSGSLGHSIQFFRDQIRIFINRILGVYTR
jgi:dolichyl-phosphate beta-glucosyltransferase